MRPAHVDGRRGEASGVLPVGGGEVRGEFCQGGPGVVPAPGIRGVHERIQTTQNKL
jgi:hypothetical protein